MLWLAIISYCVLYSGAMLHLEMFPTRYLREVDRLSDQVARETVSRGSVVMSYAYHDMLNCSGTDGKWSLFGSGKVSCAY